MEHARKGMVRVAMVVTNPCAPDPRVLRHAKWLVEAGYRVTVHAFDREEQYPLSENIDGVRVMRYQMGKVPYGSTIATVKGLRKFKRKVVETLLLDPPSLVYCHDADTLRIGVTLKNQRSVPFVFDMHDLHHTWVRMTAPQSLARSWVSGRMKQTMLKRAKKAETIITSSGALEGGKERGFVEWLMHHDLEGHAVENRPMPPFEETESLEREYWTVGYLGRIRDLKAFELLLESILCIPAHERPTIRIAGDGVIAPRVRRMMMDAVESGEIEAEVSGAFTHEEFRELIAEVDVMYAMYSPHRGNILQGALPVKMFDAAAYGVPSVVNSDCLMGELAVQERMGEAALWNEPERIAEALMAARGKEVSLQTTGMRERERWFQAMNDVLDRLQ